jgi:hypothetical protein
MAEIERMVIPAFPSEAEEAAWWDSHQALIEERFLQAAAAGKSSGASPTPTLRVLRRISVGRGSWPRAKGCGIKRTCGC